MKLLSKYCSDFQNKKKKTFSRFCVHRIAIEGTNFYCQYNIGGIGIHMQMRTTDAGALVISFYRSKKKFIQISNIFDCFNKRVEFNIS